MNTGNEQHFDIVIVGGGMVGSTMACLLRDLPCQLALVDRMDFANQQSSIDKDSEKFDPE